eukprot:SAG31_NODE_18460_length_635_cov_1.444030_1_plen_86_part_10
MPGTFEIAARNGGGEIRTADPAKQQVGFCLAAEPSTPDTGGGASDTSTAQANAPFLLMNQLSWEDSILWDSGTDGGDECTKVESDN